MATIYNQAIAHRFGVALSEFISSGEWDVFEVAVAWVRRSGTRHLLPSLLEFLEGGGTVRFTVGIDIENTTKEGLEDLLTLQTAGECRTFVYHNEALVTFHPKVYLFRNDSRARLIAGSNNITESGLFTNTEVGLQVDARLNDPVIIDIRSAMDSWCDTSENIAKELDQRLLDALSTEGYVSSENAVRNRIASAKESSRGGRGNRRKLFGTKAVSAPKPPSMPQQGPSTGAPRVQPVAGGIAVGRSLEVRGYRPLTITNALLMRIRTARGTQTQIPLQLYRCSFFNGVQSITSGHDQAERLLGPTRPDRGGGAENTCKVEIPESRNMGVPVLRLESSEAGILYRCYDANNSVQGAEIQRALDAGRNQDPPATVLTDRANPDTSTWYRFI